MAVKSDIETVQGANPVPTKTIRFDCDGRLEGLFQA